MVSDPVAQPELATIADLDSLAATLSIAFATDAMIRWPMPDATPQDLDALFRAIMTPYLELGVAWKVGAGVGCAAWLPPAEAARFAEIEVETRAAIHRLTPDGGTRYASFWDWIEAHLPAEPCWFLDLVGVRPDAQGQGIGRALITHGIDRARAAGQPAFLETGNESNVALYESLGFQRRFSRAGTRRGTDDLVHADLIDQLDNSWCIPRAASSLELRPSDVPVCSPLTARRIVDRARNCEYTFSHASPPPTAGVGHD